MEYRLDIALESSSGDTRDLASYRGKVVVLFWEAREHQSQNEALKRELGRFADDPELVRQVAVVAVGDVSAYNFQPARSIVRTTISTVARVAGIEVLFDWRGALAEPPLELERGRSNVVVLDRDGSVAWRGAGALDRAERAAMLDEVRSLLARPPGATPS
jgi:hypothetical protein